IETCPCILRITRKTGELQMTQNSDVSMPLPATANQTICSNCHSAMPSDLRFCRNCGFRLADATGTYTGIQHGEAAAPAKGKRRRMSGLSWLFVGLLVFFIGAAAFTALIAPVRRSEHFSRAPVVKSYIGIDEVRDMENKQGVVLNAVSVPNGPADKAGLIGGDVILKVDGQPVQSEDQMDELMKKTPIGKTIEIEYLRDGETKKAQLTTISMDEHRKLAREFERRPEGRAQFGYEDGDAETVPVPGTNITGVRLDTILRSRPADIAGIKDGDIVIEFDGVPIRSEDEFLMRVRRALPYSTVKVVVMRGEGDVKEKLEIPVKMGKQ
ncbi:MAG TPA: PDZ domain-containing protein, partial [Pyrinomonadaceae bacterium]|nr:PDZ domain-containing protein [Pyrinomonadaceae bacterium]